MDRRMDILPFVHDVQHQLTSFEIQEKPSITEVKVGVVSILMHQFKHLGVQDLIQKKKTKANL